MLPGCNLVPEPTGASPSDIAAAAPYPDLLPQSRLQAISDEAVQAEPRDTQALDARSRALAARAQRLAAPVLPPDDAARLRAAACDASDPPPECVGG